MKTLARCIRPLAVMGAAAAFAIPASGSPAQAQTQTQAQAQAQAQAQETTPQFCNTVTTASDPQVAQLAGLLGITLLDNAVVGLNCTPVTITGQEVNFCAYQNQFNGLLEIGRLPDGGTCP